MLGCGSSWLQTRYDLVCYGLVLLRDITVSRFYALPWVGPGPR